MVKAFRGIAILEGISYLALFGLSMPLKYLAGLKEPNIYIGNAHGILFIAYVILAVFVCKQQKWGIKRYAILFIASLLPFGTFYIEKKYFSNSLERVGNSIAE